MWVWRIAMIMGACLAAVACSGKQTSAPSTKAGDSDAPEADGGQGAGGGEGTPGGAGADGGGTSDDGAGGGDTAGTGVSGDGGTDTGGAGDDGSDVPDHVVRTDNDTDLFDPAHLVIATGETVRFEMTSRHNAVQVSEEVYNDRRVEPLEGGFVVWFGQTEDIVFSEPGVYYYICEPHVIMDMVGTITVE